MSKLNSMTKKLSKSTSAFYPKKETYTCATINLEVEGNKDIRRKSIKENLRKMVELKKENITKSKDILVSYNLIKIKNFRIENKN